MDGIIVKMKIILFVSRGVKVLADLVKHPRVKKRLKNVGIEIQNGYSSLEAKNGQSLVSMDGDFGDGTVFQQHADVNTSNTQKVKNLNRYKI